jgi:hypothetical protein
MNGMYPGIKLNYKWKLTTQLEDVDFADEILEDIPMKVHNSQEMQEY